MLWNQLPNEAELAESFNSFKEKSLAHVMPYFLVLEEDLPQTYHHYRIGCQPRRGVQLLSPICVTHCCFSWDQARSHLLTKCQLGSFELLANKL